MPIDPSVDALFDAAAQQYNLDPNVLRALHLTETGGTGRWDQTSPAGAQGGMQFIPSTAAKYGVRNPFDPQQAIPGAAHYLSDLLGDAEQQVGPGPNALTMALRNYNAGSPGHWNNPETAAYAGTVARYYTGLKSPAPEKPMNGIDQLAAAGQPSAPPPTQMAQAGGMSDDDLLNGFVNGTLPFLPKPGGAVPSGAAMPSGTPALPSAPAQPTGTPALDVQGLVDTYNRYQGFPAGIPLAQGALSILQKMAPEGYTLNQDGSLSLRQGMVQGANAVAAGKAAGEKEQTLGPNGISPIPGAIQSNAQAAAAEQEAKTRNTVFMDRPGAQPVTGAQVLDAANGGPNAPVQGAVPGKSSLYNNPGIAKGEDIAAEDYGKLKEAYLSNQGATQNLQNFLEAAAATGTGKGTELSGHAAAWLKSIGVDPQKLSLADPAEVERMRKSATQMIFQQIGAVSKRPAYQEFQMLEQANPNPDLQPEANRAIAASLLGRMQWENGLFKAWDADRRGSQAGGSYGHFDLPAWAEANPMPGFQASAYSSVPAIPDRGVAGKSQAGAQPSIQEGQIIKNPQTGERRVMRGGNFVPLQ